MDRYSELLTPDGPCTGLAVDLHGSGLDVARHRLMNGLAELLLAQGIAVLLPQGAIPFRLMALEPGWAWNVPGVPLPGRAEAEAAQDDLAWLDTLVATNRSNLGITSAPLFITGYSGGARLASYLLAKSPHTWTAAAVVAGLRAVAGKAPPPTLAFHGLDDPINPYAGSSEPRWDMGVEQAASHYPRIELHTLPAVGHAWPGSTDADHLDAFGSAGALDASAMIAAFFARHLTQQDD